MSLGGVFFFLLPKTLTIYVTNKGCFRTHYKLYTNPPERGSSPLLLSEPGTSSSVYPVWIGFQSPGGERRFDYVTFLVPNVHSPFLIFEWSEDKRRQDMFGKGGRARS